MPVYSLDGLVPVVDPAAFVHPQAVLIGDVIVAARCYVGPGASLRGDFGRVILSAGSNVQDCCVLHSFPARDTLLEEDSHIGHGAVLHGCTVFVGAASFVRAGFVVPRRTLVTGVPARIVRTLTPEELAWKATGTREYQQLAERCLATLRECQPLAAAEAGRPSMGGSSAVPLHSIGRPKDLRP
ncbi:MAG: phenylacetic acid degradation protein PaaY [Gammaproteobacteria bacterium]|nr:MAG: phenylacetic acid degradation protein PaaY [Gammaproteobacteria bacterium]